MSFLHTQPWALDHPATSSLQGHNQQVISILLLLRVRAFPFFFTDPSGTPSNTTGLALNSTHIYIDWDPPPLDQQNGELREYRITINEVETSILRTISSDSDVTEAIVGPLHPYYTYNCTILAVTVGEGPPSTVITVRTEEDGKTSAPRKQTESVLCDMALLTTVPSGPPTNFTFSVESSTSVLLSWEPPLPEERNGIIRQYSIRVELPVGEFITYTTGSNSYTVSGLKPFTAYLFSVAAVTIGTGVSTERIVAQTFADGKILWHVSFI